jgi:uncharacterized protein
LFLVNNFFIENYMIIFKKIHFSFLLLLGSVMVFAQQMPDRPNPPRLVNDFTNTLTPDQIQTLESKLVALDDATSTQIAVVIVPSTNGATIADYNVELMRKWGVGSKKNNNGVILLVAKNDRKLDITVGYGVEGALTDATAKSIIDDIIVPNFKGDDYYRGIDQGTDAIVKAVKGQYTEPRDKKSGKGGGSSFIFIFIIIIIFIVLSRKGGGGGGTFMSRRGQRGIGDAIFWNVLLNSGGRGGGGGGWIGGGDSGGGGGFGGFGGGSGGGGGASGDW